MEKSEINPRPVYYKNLVFRAGGVLGIAYVGAIKALEKHGLVEGIDRVAGSSAGSITAVAVSCGYNSGELEQLLKKTPFKNFLDGWINPFRFYQRYGVYKGDFLLKWLEKTITDSPIGKEYGFQSGATFEDFHKANCKDMYIMATDLNTKSIVEFSYRKTPEVSVAEACRASMAIPGFFPAWRFKKGYKNDHIFVDGGVLDLFPISLFDHKDFGVKEGEVNWETLGFYLVNLDEPSEDDENKEVPKGGKSGQNHSKDCSSGKRYSIDDGLKFGHPYQWVKDLFGTIMMQQQSAYKNDPLQQKRTININDHGISATNFHLTDADKRCLQVSGYNDTMEWLRERKGKSRLI